MHMYVWIYVWAYVYLCKKERDIKPIKTWKTDESHPTVLIVLLEKNVLQ